MGGRERESLQGIVSGSGRQLEGSETRTSQGAGRGGGGCQRERDVGGDSSGRGEGDCSGKVKQGAVDCGVGGFNVRTDYGGAEGLQLEMFASDPAADNAGLAPEVAGDRADVARVVREQGS